VVRGSGIEAHLKLIDFIGIERPKYGENNLFPVICSVLKDKIVWDFRISFLQA